jgi:hypothetical protein
MTLQQTLQADTKKTLELFKKLEETSDQAVKTRENVLGDLSRELRQYAEIEERDLFPALRRDPKAKDLVTEAVKRNRDLKNQLDELDALPKNDASFRERVTGLRKLFQQQIREERQELLPAVPEDRRDQLEEKIENRRAKLEEERQAEEDQRREAARREAEQKKQEAEQKREEEDRERAAEAQREAARKAAEEQREATRKAARDATARFAETAQEGAEALRETSKQAAEATFAAARRVRDAADETVSGVRDSLRESQDEVKAVTGSFATFLRVSSELNSILISSAWQSARHQLELTGELIRDPLNFGQIQREYAITASRLRMETINRVLQVIGSASAAAVEPLEEQLRAA